MRIKLRCLAVLLMVAMFVPGAFAGNEDRAGSAGGSYLLVNPWARSSGLASAHMANAIGVEASFLNVAGMAFIDKTELMFTQTIYLAGSNAGININAIGFAQRVNESSVLGLSVNNWNFGDLETTTTEQPEGNGTTFSPNVLTIAASYARAFSNSIYGGITLRVLSESTSQIRSTGVAFDAGIKYVTGENDRVKIGIALKNVGPEMNYKGDGLAFQAEPNGTQLTVEHRAASSELPSLVSIGATYDFNLGENHRITPGATFVANSFVKDNFLGGIEYSFKELFALRGGYHYEGGITGDEDRTTVLTGAHAGLSVHVPLGKSGSDLSFDYSYRFTNPFSGIHSIGVAVGIK